MNASSAGHAVPAAVAEGREDDQALDEQEDRRCDVEDDVVQLARRVAAIRDGRLPADRKEAVEDAPGRQARDRS